MYELSISNIAWSAEYDADLYKQLKVLGYKGLEIAPTRVFPEAPYSHISEAKDWALELKKTYGLSISSIQSIWYGHSEKIFGDASDRKILVNYTKQAILFAEAIGCSNLVFGNPKNRDTEDVVSAYPTAIEFFKEIGDYALEHHTNIAIEPNPTIYNTRFLNYTEQAVEMAYKSGSEGVKVNIDLGTIIYNKEDTCYLTQISEYINHIHISEPGLKPIEKRSLHQQLIEVVKKINYNRFVSIEMGNCNDTGRVIDIMNYVKSVAV